MWPAGLSLGSCSVSAVRLLCMLTYCGNSLEGSHDKRCEHDVCHSQSSFARRATAVCRSVRTSCKHGRACGATQFRIGTGLQAAKQDANMLCHLDALMTSELASLAKRQGSISTRSADFASHNLRRGTGPSSIKSSGASVTDPGGHVGIAGQACRNKCWLPRTSSDQLEGMFRT